MGVTKGGLRTGASGVGATVEHVSLLAVALGAIAAIMAALLSNGSYRKIYNKATLWSSSTAKKLTATVTGVAGDVKNIQVTIIGTDAADAPLTEVLPAFTLDTLGTVTSVGLFKTVTEVRIPAHDGLGALTSIGVSGSSTIEVLPAWVDKGVQSIFYADLAALAIVNPAVPRNITATAGGTNTDIKAIAVKIFGTNSDDAAINETLPVFTVDTAGTVVGAKAFKTIDSVEIPPHDGNLASTSIGTGAKLGIGKAVARDTTFAAYLNNVREVVAPTVVFNAAAVESNTFQLSSALNGTAVDYYYFNG